MMFINTIFFSGGGALEYESDGVPTGERKQGAFDVGFRRKKGHWLWDPKKIGTILV